MQKTEIIFLGEKMERNGFRPSLLYLCVDSFGLVLPFNRKITMWAHNSTNMLRDDC